ncbi:hypothetical protein D9M68_984810 [compost metagenome]
MGAVFLAGIGFRLDASLLVGLALAFGRGSRFGAGPSIPLGLFGAALGLDLLALGLFCL